MTCARAEHSVDDDDDDDDDILLAFFLFSFFLTLVFTLPNAGLKSLAVHGIQGKHCFPLIYQTIKRKINRPTKIISLIFLSRRVE